MKFATTRFDTSTWIALMHLENLLTLLEEGESVHFSNQDGQLKVTAEKGVEKVSFLVSRGDDVKTSVALLERVVRMSL